MPGSHLGNPNERTGISPCFINHADLFRGMLEGANGVDRRRILRRTGDELHIVIPILENDRFATLGPGEDAGEIAFRLGDFDRFHES